MTIVIDELAFQNGTVVGTINQAAGVNNQALSNSGTNNSNYVDCSGIFSNAETEFSVSFWLQVDTLFADTYILHAGDSEVINPTDEFKIYLTGANLLTVRVKDGANFITHTIATNNAFHHIVAMFKDSTLTFYYDNVLVGSTQDLLVTSVDLSFIYLMNRLNGVNGFDGQIDEIRFHNRELTVEEIDFLYHEFD